MAGIKTWSGLENALRQNTKYAMLYVGDTVKRVLIDSINRMWYSRSNPEYYQRTMDVLNSITVENVSVNKNQYNARIYFDEDKINMVEVPGGWNQHMSLNKDTSYEGQSIAEWTVFWMEFGQNSPVYSYEGGGHITATREYAEGEAVYLIEEALQKVGIRCIVIKR